MEPSPGNRAGVDAEGDVAADACALQPRQLHVQQVPKVLAEPSGGGLGEMVTQGHRALDAERTERFEIEV